MSEVENSRSGVYVIVHTEATKTKAVCRRLKELPQSVFAIPVSDLPFDECGIAYITDRILFFMQFETLSELRSVLDDSIRQLIDTGDILGTDTRLVLMKHFRGYSAQDLDSIAAAAWIFIRLGAGDPHPISETVSRVRGVARVHPLIGPDDAITFVRAEGPFELRRTIEEIQSLSGIEIIETMLIHPEKVE